jgi:hypothetical protein
MNRTVIRVDSAGQSSRIGQLKAAQRAAYGYAPGFSTMLQIAAAFQWLETKIGDAM